MEVCWILLMLFLTSVGQANEVVISVPVVDAFLEVPDSEMQPLCSFKPGDSCCQRVHQLLLHERAMVEEEIEEWCKISVFNLYIGAARQHSFWVQKKYMRPVTEQTEKLLPAPINYDVSESVGAPRVIALTKPWYCEKTNSMCSAGTRFLVERFSDNVAFTYILTPHGALEQVEIPKEYWLYAYGMSPHKKLASYVRVIKEWANNVPDGFIPYVWGGCSYQYAYHGQYRLNVAVASAGSWYELPEDHYFPQSGVDCSSLILRASQICGIPYFCKNTSTLREHLKELKENDPIEPGDVIWIPGHVLIISDVERSLVVEARGYNGGYGYVHEVPLSEVFAWQTLAELKEHSITKKPVLRRDRAGAVSVALCAILRFRSTVCPDHLQKSAHY